MNRLYAAIVRVAERAPKVKGCWVSRERLYVEVLEELVLTGEWSRLSEGPPSQPPRTSSRLYTGPWSRLGPRSKPSPGAVTLGGGLPRRRRILQGQAIPKP